MNVGILGKGGNIGVQNRKKITIQKENGVEVQEIEDQIKHRVVVIYQIEKKQMKKTTTPK